MISPPEPSVATIEQTPAMTEWDEQLQLFGKVELKQKVGRVILVFGAIILSVIVGVVLGFASEGIDLQALAWVVGVLAVIIGGPMIFYFAWYRTKTVIVETDGVRLTDGYLLPWAGIEGAGLWTHRGNASVTLGLDEDTMRLYQANQSRAARMLTKANAGITRSRAVFLPGTLDANPEELAAWLNIQIDRRRVPEGDAFTW